LYTDDLMFEVFFIYYLDIKWFSQNQLSSIALAISIASVISIASATSIVL